MADEEYRQFERDHVVGGYHSAEPLIRKRLRLGHDLTEICHDILRANLTVDYNIDGIVKEIIQFRAEANHPRMKKLGAHLHNYQQKLSDLLNVIQPQHRLN